MSVRDVLPILPSRRQIRGVLTRPVQLVDPAGWIGTLRWPGPVPPGAGLLCVYRSRFVPDVERVVAEAHELGMAVALWGLDGAASSLEQDTVGVGPGGRIDLLNRLYASIDSTAPGPLVFADDDVAFARGGLSTLLRSVGRCGFDLAQPSHAPGSFRSFRITFSHYLTLARRVTWIEVGPVVVVGPRWRDQLLPFPAGFGMGWGLEMCWAELGRQGCRLGIVDAVTIDHLGLVGTDYDVTVERARASALRQHLGITSIVGLQRSLGSWRVWRRHPPWETPSSGPRRAGRRRRGDGRASGPRLASPTGGRSGPAWGRRRR